jgi:hypothetical protein
LKFKRAAFCVDLETGVSVGGRNFEVDVMLTGRSGKREHRIAIEMKCYRTMASSGKPRGATDIFMKDVYEDLSITERYVDCGLAQEGVVLVMNDNSNFVQPADRTAKCWNYDISHGARFGPISLSTPIGGKQVNIDLKRAYVLNWDQQGKFWFLETQGI